MPEYSEHHGERRGGRRDGRRRERRDQEENDSEENEREDSERQQPQSKLTQEQIEHMAAAAAGRTIDDAAKQIAQLKDDLTKTKSEVETLKTQVKKPEESKKAEEVSKPTEPAKPVETPKPVTAAPAPVPEKSFLDVLGDGFKMIGEIPGKIVRAGIKLALTPLAAAAKVIEGFWKGLTTPLFGPPKKTA